MVDCFPNIDADILDLMLETNNEVTNADSLYQWDSTAGMNLDQHGSTISSYVTECIDNILNDNITSTGSSSVFNQCTSPIVYDLGCSSQNNQFEPSTLNLDGILNQNQCVASTRNVELLIDDSLIQNQFASLRNEVMAIPHVPDKSLKQGVPSELCIPLIPDSFFNNHWLPVRNATLKVDTLANREIEHNLPQSISEIQKTVAAPNLGPTSNTTHCSMTNQNGTVLDTSRNSFSGNALLNTDLSSSSRSSSRSTTPRQESSRHSTTPSPDTSLKQEDIGRSLKESRNQPPHSKAGNKSSQVNDLLPPCRVCDDKASGFHYGVNSCEACKGFFRRSLVKMQKNEDGYKCNGYGNCEIVFGKRKSCSACRYKKCLSLGMSKNAIKTGRYTVQKKTENIKEVNKLKAVAIGASLTSICNLSDMECQYIISRLVITQRKIDPSFSKIFDKAFNLRKQNQVYEQYLKKKKTNSELNLLSSDLYAEIYIETGVDLDNRGSFYDVYARKTILFIENMVEFLKSIPGINSISSEDQKTLLKESAADYCFLAEHKMMNPDLLVINDFDGPEDLSMHKEEFQHWYKKQEYIDEMFDMVRPFQRLELTEEEVGIVRGIVVTSTDRCDLQHPEIVQEIQLKLTECLRWLLIKTTKNPEQRFYKILDRLILLRSLAAVCENLTKEELSWPEIQKYPVLVEFMSQK